MILNSEITHQDLKYVEACLRCLRTIFTSSVAPTDIVYQVKTRNDVIFGMDVACLPTLQRYKFNGP